MMFWMDMYMGIAHITLALKPHEDNPLCKAIRYSNPVAYPFPTCLRCIGELDRLEQLALRYIQRGLLDGP